MDEVTDIPCPECYGTGGLYDLALGIDDPCATCNGCGALPKDCPVCGGTECTPNYIHDPLAYEFTICLEEVVQ